jgi:hypothetical protein
MKKEEIQRRYSEWIQKKKFAPDSFKYKEEIDKITGLYVPFWLFDSLAEGSIVSDCTKVRNWSDSNYNYTETKYYKVTRKGEGYYTKVPIDGLSDLEDSLVKKIEPFNYKEMVDFSMGYMAGFLAEKYNVPSDDAETEVRKRIDVFLEDSLKDTINGYNSSTILSKNFSILSFLHSLIGKILIENVHNRVFHLYAKHLFRLFHRTTRGMKDVIHRDIRLSFAHDFHKFFPLHVAEVGFLSVMRIQFFANSAERHSAFGNGNKRLAARNILLLDASVNDLRKVVCVDMLYGI